MSFSSLPDEIIENILARVPKWSYPNLSLVSKRFLSLLSSPQLYTTRFNIGTTEPCLYVCVELVNHSSPKWFTLWMKPQETRNGEILNDFSLIPLPSSPYSPPCVLNKSTVAVGSEIYVIGGIYKVSSSSVQILDCRSRTWRDAPNMTVARSSGPSAVYLDEKIYVMGGCKNDESANWFEVFNIKTQTWKALPNPDHELREYFNFNPDALEKKLYLATETKDYTYEPKDGIWKVAREVSSCQQILYSCVIENVMYSFCDSHGHIKWYDTEAREWREVKGLESFYIYRWGLNCMVNYGGKLVVMWRQWPVNHSQNPKTEICCAKIALEKRHGDEIWGTLEWRNIVLTFPNSYHCLTTCVAVSI